MAKNLIVIPCCKRKIPGGVIKAAPLTYFDNPSLVPTLIAKRAISMDLNPPIKPFEFMEAWDRYDGGLYRNLKLCQPLINNLINRDCLDIIIISALYGVINYNTPINNYDLTMTIAHRKLWENSISNSINNYCEATNIKTVYTFLRPDTYYSVTTNGVLLNHTQIWPIGIRGVNNIYNNVANNIIGLLDKINKECK